MMYRTLGNSGLRVSALTLGTMGFGGQGAFKSVGELGHQAANASDRLSAADRAGLDPWLS